MSIETIIALMGFTFVISITPGPGNLLLLSSGARFGFRQSIPLVLGICVGFMTLIVLVGIGAEWVFVRIPALYTVLKIACTVYILKLAWTIALSRPLESGQNAILTKPVGLAQAAMLQLVSPKAWALTPVLIVSYANPDSYLLSLMLMIPVCSLVNIPSTSVWALFGVAIKRFLGKGDWAVWFQYLLAALLLMSIIPMLLD